MDNSNKIYIFQPSFTWYSTTPYLYKGRLLWVCHVALVTWLDDQPKSTGDPARGRPFTIESFELDSEWYHPTSISPAAASARPQFRCPPLLISSQNFVSVRLSSNVCTRLLSLPPLVSQGGYTLYISISLRVRMRTTDYSVPLFSWSYAAWVLG